MGGIRNLKGAPGYPQGIAKVPQDAPKMPPGCVTVVLQTHPPHQHRLAHASSGKLVHA